MDGRENRWMYLLAAIGVAAVVAAALVSRRIGRAEITGETAEERIACISRLAAKGGLGAGEAIAGAATGDRIAAVRQVALMSLGKFIAPEHRRAVLAGTRDDDPRCRSAAAGTLALYHDDDAADRLDEMAKSDADRQVRLDSATAMGNCRADKALVLLVEATENSDSPDVQLHAARVLARKYSIDGEALDPQKQREWRHFIETIKSAPGVAETFRRLSRPLKRNPKDLIPAPAEH